MKKLKVLIIIGLSLLLNPSFCQITDDFNDGDFSHNPSWEGDVTLFSVINQQLQLNAPEAGDAYLSLRHNYNATELEWLFSIKMSFSPSQNNYARVYLLADTTNLKSNRLKGFFLQFGEVGAEDVIELFYQNEGTFHSVFRGVTSIASGVLCNIKVTKSSTDSWTLYVDAHQNGLYVEEASAIAEVNYNDLIYNVLGLYCKYTSSYKDKFFFDNFYYGAPVQDTIKPVVVSVEANLEDYHQVRVEFSEVVTPESALDTNYYIVSELRQKPIRCSFIDEDYRQVLLTFANTFNERQNYTLQMSGIRDFADNEMVVTENNFLFYTLQRNEILITEIMSDPTPQVQLPECEYIELYNSLPFPVTLKNGLLRVGNNNKELPTLIFPPESYLLLIPKSGDSLFLDYENKYSVSSLSITDDGQSITLYDFRGNVLHYVNFSKEWHTNQLKREGGWSLEMMDLQNACSGQSNWNSSQSESGGTPGAVNSINTQNEDVEKPNLLKITVVDSTHIFVFFDETVLPDSLQWLSMFAIDRNEEVVSVVPQLPENRSFLLTLSSPLLSHTIYTLTVMQPLCDCAGNESGAGAFARFGLPEAPAAFDVVINEILSNPFEDTDADFIELYNRSDKIIDLAQLKVGSGWGEQPDNAVAVVEDGYLLFPEQYIVISKNSALTGEQYYSPAPDAILENRSLPTLPNDEGVVHLVDFAYNRIDKMLYTKDMHYPLLQSLEGVSLERIHFDAVTQDADNWKSAAEGVGWATPAYRNSQFSKNMESDRTVEVIPEIFSPDGDGFDDYTEIFCHFPETENRVTINIYDRYGHLVKQLINNRICGFTEHFRWDGITDDGREVLNDIYVVAMQMWNQKGERKVYRKTVAIVRRT